MQKLRAVISVHTSEWGWRREREGASASLTVTSTHNKYSAASPVSAGRERGYVAAAVLAPQFCMSSVPVHS